MVEITIKKSALTEEAGSDVSNSGSDDEVRSSLVLIRGGQVLFR